jgi:hypothetical protein
LASPLALTTHAACEPPQVRPRINNRARQLRPIMRFASLDSTRSLHFDSDLAARPADDSSHLTLAQLSALRLGSRALLADFPRPETLSGPRKVARRFILARWRLECFRSTARHVSTSQRPEEARQLIITPRPTSPASVSSHPLLSVISH